ncbi:nucleoside triphosphate pyrophosphohydrolase [Peribacillus acanthi]|uniref:nucleoside triphosphate pyrophosphohydrolase n=1 Tax=Peribacillus acanthi TaxID=2171554 RepID=UPI000D3EE028|nr:nucleoside triphosphate pyrophosphohydrolase [Peribacillus acanthi]
MARNITIVGLGAGDLLQLPLGIYRKLITHSHCYVRTLDHPVIAELESEGMVFTSFDSVYEKHDTFPEVYEEISEILLEKAKTEDVLYAVPGHPMVAERSVQLLLEKGEERGVQISIEGGQSFLDPLFQSMNVDPIEGFQLLDGTELKRDEIIMTHHLIIGQVYDAFIASEVKLTLMEKYPDDHEVFLVTAAGSIHEKIVPVPLFELDHNMELSNLTSVYVPPVKEEQHFYKEFTKLREIIAELRGPNGCPWDKKQTHSSLKKYLIEEAYELIDAINEEDDDAMIGELGDVLLQVMLHSQIGEDEGMFSIADVIEGISAKMVRRHPHVFGTVHVEDEKDVIANWEQIKQREKGNEITKSLLDGVEKSMPQLMIAAEYQKRAAKVGFDWVEIAPAWEKVKEEIKEFEDEMGNKEIDQVKLEAELGDIFFALVNIARYYSVHPEEAIHRTNEKFLKRFRHVEQRVQESGKLFEDFALEELDAFWDEAKQRGL